MNNTTNDIWLFACNFQLTEEGITFNDIYTNDGNIAIVSGVDCMQQLCAQSLWLWFGEWVMNNKIGVSYKRIFSDVGSQDALVSYQINTAIMSINSYLPKKYIPIYGIKKVVINSYNLDRSSRQLSINIDIILNSNKEVSVII